MAKSISVAMVTICTILAIGGYPQTSKVNPPNLSNKETDTLVTDLGDILKQAYFDPVKAEAINRVLVQKLTAGDFYGLPVDTLTKKLTHLLRSETRDIHFYVGHTKKAQVGTPPTGTVDPPAKEYPNGGFTEVRLLENNIGYIKWVHCIADDGSFKKMLSALNFLSGCDYLIIDISNNPGGDGKSSGFINQYLYRSTDYQDLLIKKCVGEQEWHQSEVVYNHSDGPKFFDTPLFIIASGNTASAAEYFAFTAQEMKRATILGKTTAGAGNPVTRIDFEDYFAYVPICEIRTVKGKSIEAKGVVPDVELQSGDWIKETTEYIKRKK